MKPCEVCGKECKGRTCSGACRAKLSRRTRTVKADVAHAHEVTPEQVTAQAESGVRRAGAEFFEALAKTALTTQKQDEHEPAQSTKSDEVTVEQPVTFDDVAELYNHDAPSLEHYRACPDQYVTRQEPERINWGAWLNMDELKRAGFKCNRVAIPGDWDYVGCVTPERSAISKGKAQPTTAAPVTRKQLEDVGANPRTVESLDAHPSAFEATPASAEVNA